MVSTAEGSETARNLETVRRWVEEMWTTEAAVADGDIVAIRVLSTGTNLGKLNGVLPASDRAFAARQDQWFRLQGCRIGEHWAVRDDLTSVLQLGAVTSPVSVPCSDRCRTPLGTE